MDDLESLRVALTGEPSQDTIDRGRHRLMNAARRPAPRRRGLLAAGVLALGASAAAVITLLPSATPQQAPAEARPSVSVPVQLTGRQILLAAADTAQRVAEEPGKYWHVVIEHTGSGTIVKGRKDESWRAEWWYRRSDGHLFGGTPDGKAMDNPKSGDFWVLDHSFTYQELQELPTDPEALKELALKGMREGLKGERPRVGEDGYVALSMSYLLYDVPIPPQVRAGVLRAIAALPIVSSTGDVDGGHGVTVDVKDSSFTLVVDPETGLLRSIVTSPGNTIDITTAEWTDDLPEVVPPPAE
ncbi:CU044_5270 family protein [Herbidospora cretacea]|uniref:CU044_5270 family protein n=1 Tax=Herbidospora cretacea TaxID=28444 RepID=UPI0004C2FFFF|nr:CU044_5270 family protein [Herbidospora cretacea]